MIILFPFGLLLVYAGIRNLFQFIKNKCNPMLEVQLTCVHSMYDTINMITSNTNASEVADKIGQYLSEQSVKQTGQDYVNADVPVVVWEYEFQGKLYREEEVIGDECTFKQGDIAKGYIDQKNPTVMTREPIGNQHLGMIILCLLFGALILCAPFM